MIIILQEEKYIRKTYLPKETSEKIQLKGKNGTKFVDIYQKNGKWFVIKNEKIQIINRESNEDKEIQLENYAMYIFQDMRSNKKFVIHCLPTYEKEMTHLKLKRLNHITIGKKESCSIRYNNNMVSNIHATLYLNKNKWVVENHNKNVGIIINREKVVSGQKNLENGDEIYILGLKIIVIGGSIFINNNANMFEYDTNMFDLNENPKWIKDGDIEGYKDEEDKKNYYSRPPRIINNHINRQFKISTPPIKRENNRMPPILTLGSTITMGLMSVVTFATSITGLVKGTTSFGEGISSIIIAFLMLISVLLIPILMERWETNNEKKYEMKRQSRYNNYLAFKNNELIKLKKQQKEALEKNYPTVQECNNIVLNQTDRMWERKIKDYDFLCINLGVGNDRFCESNEETNENFELEKDELVDKMNELKEKSKIIENVPITLSIKKEKIVGIIDKNNNIKNTIQEILVQIMAFHDYDELKTVFLLKRDSQIDWNYIKMLPYVWDKSNNFRFIGTDYDTNREDISAFLEKEFKERQEIIKEQDTFYKPYYLIITDDFNSIADLNIISDIQQTKEDIGFGILSIGNTIKDLPESCKTFIEIEGNSGKLIKSGASQNEQKEFILSAPTNIQFDRIIQIVGNIPIKVKLEDASFPEKYTFLDMLKVGNKEELNIRNRWKNNNTIESMSTPIGIDERGNILKLDVHEKAHGPHGLIAGATGSRKIRIYNIIYTITCC